MSLKISTGMTWTAVGRFAALKAVKTLPPSFWCESQRISIYCECDILIGAKQFHLEILFYLSFFLKIKGFNSNKRCVSSSLSNFKFMMQYLKTTKRDKGHNQMELRYLVIGTRYHNINGSKWLPYVFSLKWMPSIWHSGIVHRKSVLRLSYIKWSMFQF